MKNNPAQNENLRSRLKPLRPLLTGWYRCGRLWPLRTVLFDRYYFSRFHGVFRCVCARACVSLPLLRARRHFACAGIRRARLRLLRWCGRASCCRGCSRRGRSRPRGLSSTGSCRTCPSCHTREAVVGEVTRRLCLRAEMRTRIITCISLSRASQEKAACVCQVSMSR